MSAILSVEEAKAIIKAGLGRAELEFAVSIAVPLYWIVEAEGAFYARNGSAFFLDAGKGVFGVTANHVIQGLVADQKTKNVVECQIGGDLQFQPSRLVDAHEKLDVATFGITQKEVTGLNKTVLTGHQKKWPPAPPQDGRGIHFAGFPGLETIFASKQEISFGAAALSGVASSVSDRDVSMLIERENLIDVFGQGEPAAGYDFGGISGGPMLTVVDDEKGLRSWRLAGVIYEGPNSSLGGEETLPGFELIRARRADFLGNDGRLVTGEYF